MNPLTSMSRLLPFVPHFLPFIHFPYGLSPPYDTFDSGKLPEY